MAHGIGFSLKIKVESFLKWIYLSKNNISNTKYMRLGVIEIRYMSRQQNVKEGSLANTGIERCFKPSMRDLWEILEMSGQTAHAKAFLCNSTF